MRSQSWPKIVSGRHDVISKTAHFKQDTLVKGEHRRSVCSLELLSIIRHNSAKRSRVPSGPKSTTTTKNLVSKENPATFLDYSKFEIQSILLWIASHTQVAWVGSTYNTEIHQSILWILRIPVLMAKPLGHIYFPSLPISSLPHWLYDWCLYHII